MLTEDEWIGDGEEISNEGIGKNPPIESELELIPEDGSVQFIIEGRTFMEFKPNGDIYVKGKLVENDKEVVQGMREFLQNVNKKS